MTRKSNNRIIYIIPIIYIIVVSVFMLWHRAWLSPDQFFAFAILSVILIGRTRDFLWDWIPVLLLLFGYEYLRGIVPQLTDHANIWPMIVADHFLFGFIPTVKLQSLFFDGYNLHWYDYVSVILYISHFIVPMVVAFILWMHDRRTFKEFTTAFLILSYLAFMTFIIFPAMPPWMAASDGYLPPLAKIMDQVMGSFAHPISVPSIYQFFGANLVAAVPSLHAAYPWLIFLFVRQKIHNFAYLILPYVFGVWFAVIYLGEHYAVDVIAGIIYASFAYLVINFLKKKQSMSAIAVYNQNIERG